MEKMACERELCAFMFVAPTAPEMTGKIPSTVPASTLAHVSLLSHLSDFSCHDCSCMGSMNNQMRLLQNEGDDEYISVIRLKATSEADFDLASVHGGQRRQPSLSGVL